MKKNISTLIALSLLTGVISNASAADTKTKDGELESPIKLGNGMEITSITHPLPDFDPLIPVEPQSLTRATSYEYPTLPLAGFTPYVAIKTSNRGSSTGAYGDMDMEHAMRTGYIGSPLSSDPEYPDGPFVIGILDTGADTDLAAGTAAAKLGLTGSRLTSNTMDLSGAGGDTLSAYVSQPVGYFAAGLGGVKPDNTIDPNYMIGHTNVSVLASPAIYCNGEEAISAVIGRPALTFTTTVIRNDIRRTVTVDGRTYTGPDIQFLPVGSENIPAYTRRLSMLLDGQVPVQTAAWYYDIYAMMLDPFNSDYQPAYPTLLTSAAGTLPTSAMFTAIVDVYHGDEVEKLTMMVDTGAQSSILRTYAADSLSLPLEGDFTIDVCGVGGMADSMPVYYIDRVKISAGGGALNFSHVPFLVMDIAGEFDGILGMNFFYDRNITLSPDVSTGSYRIYISDPVDFANADINGDSNVNLEDFAGFANAWQSTSDDANYNIACDLFLSDSIDFNDLELFAENWLE